MYVVPTTAGEIEVESRLTAMMACLFSLADEVLCRLLDPH
jgi:hypothetical protein